MTVGIDTALSDTGVESNPTEGNWREGLTGTILGARELKAALRRRRRLWVCTAAAGLIFGGALHVVLPKSYKAVTNLYLVEPSGSTPAIAMNNELSLLETRTVAQQAARNLLDHPNAQNMAISYKGLPVSDSILSVISKGKSPADAVAVDTAVAKAFLTVRGDQLKREDNILLAGLQGQISDLQKQSNLNGNQISQLQNQVLSVELNLKSSVDGSFVLDPAAAVRASSKKVTVEDMLSGLIAGLGLGLGIVVVGEMLSDRARRRDQVAAALGVDVELSTARPRCRPRLGLLQPDGQRASVTEMVARRLSAHVRASPSQALAIISVQAEKVAASAVSNLASSLASERRDVLIVDMAKGRPLAKLFRLEVGPEMVHRVDMQECHVTVVIAPEDPARAESHVERAPRDVVLVLASADLAFGVEHVADWATESVVIVTAGKASNTRLDGIGRMIRQAGIALRSTILVGADPEDDSTGLLDSGAGSAERSCPAPAISAGEW